MIENDSQLQLTFEQLERMCKVLAHFRATILPVNPRQYALFAEGPVDEIQKLEAEINTYLGVDDAAGATTPDATVEANPILRETPPRYGEPGKS